MDKLQRLSSEDRDNLPAYLDGELNEDATRRIESILVQSSVARNDIELLSKTYDLLDELPHPDASKDFLKKTLATVKMEEVKVPISDQLWFQNTQKVLVLIGWTVALMIASAGGFAVTNRMIERPDDILAEELPLMKNLDRYEEVQSFEFLNQLSASEELLKQMGKATSHEQK